MRLWMLATAAALCCPSLVHAQEAGVEGEAPTPPIERTPAPVTFELRGGAAYAFDTEFDDGGRYSTFRLVSGATFSWRASEALDLALGVEYEYSGYDFDDASDFVAGLGDDPFDEFNALALSVRGTYRFDETWSVTGSGFGVAAFESGADTSDAWRGGGFGAVGVRFSETLLLGFGVGAVSQFNDDPFVFPVVIVRWQFAERWLLANERLGAKLSYRVNDEFDVYARAEFVRRLYRLDDDHPVVGGGALRDRRVPVGLGFEWRPVAGLSVEVEAGASLSTELRFRTDGGEIVADRSADPAAYVGVSVRYRF